MELRALTAAAVRFFALYVLLGCIETAGEIAETLALPKELTSGGMTYVMTTHLVFSLLAAWFLLARTRVVTGWVLRGEASGDEKVTLTSRDLMLVAFSLAGLIFLVSGLQSIVNQVFGWYFAPHRIPTGPAGAQVGRMAGSVLEILVGIGLLLAFRGPRAGKPERNPGTLVAVAVSVLLAAPTAALCADPPTTQSLIAAWEHVQSTDPHTKAFQKTSEGHYRFRTDWFPYDGELVVLNAVVAPLAEGVDQPWARMMTGHVDVDLPGLTGEQRDKLSSGIEIWERSNTLHFDPQAQRWLTPAEFQKQMMAEAQRTSSHWPWLGLLTGYAVPLGLLVFLLFTWLSTSRRSKSVLAESLRMSQRSLENQTRMIELLEQTVALLEKRPGG